MRLGRRLEEVDEAVVGGYFRLQTRLKLALAVRETVAGHRLGAREEGGGPPPFPMHPPPTSPRGDGSQRSRVPPTTLFVPSSKMAPTA